MEANQVEFWVGQAMVDAAGAAERVGVLGGEVALYCVARRVKSADVWTLDVSGSQELGERREGEESRVSEME